MVFPFLSGCQTAGFPTRAQFIEQRQAVLNMELAAAAVVEPLKASLCAPADWKPLPLQKTALYTHQQWRSASRRTAVGITYIRMPLPLGTKTLVWFAMNEAGKRSNDGKIIRQWNDSMGREWFEAENAKYHTTGYVITRGFDAWINYCGYRVTEPRDPEEIELGERALRTIIPQVGKGLAESMQTASASDQ